MFCNYKYFFKKYSFLLKVLQFFFNISNYNIKFLKRTLNYKRNLKFCKYIENILKDVKIKSKKINVTTSFHIGNRTQTCLMLFRKFNDVIFLIQLLTFLNILPRTFATALGLTFS